MLQLLKRFRGLIWSIGLIRLIGPITPRQAKAYRTFTFILLLALSLNVFPQTPQPQSTTKSEQDDVVKINTNLVQVDAVVTKDGKPVHNLKVEDFEIFEDGHKQEITSFAFISNVATSPAPRVDANGPPVSSRPAQLNEPRRVMALVVDDLGLSVQSVESIRKQLRKFIDEQLAPNDLVAIIRTGGTMGALQQFTSDRRMIEKALTQVRWNVCSRVGTTVFKSIDPLTNRSAQESGPCGNTSVNSIYDTMRSLRFIVDAMGEIPGRKSLVFFSDSLPREEQDFTSTFAPPDEEAGPPSSISVDNRNFGAMLYKIAEKAIRSSVVIYSVDTSGLQYTGLTAADSLSTNTAPYSNGAINSAMTRRAQQQIQRREGSELIAKETGGFLVQNSNGFQLDRIAEDQTGYYLLGYRPSGETFNRKFHHIKASVKKSGLTLRTRYGFYGVSEDEVKAASRTPSDKATVALLSPFGAQEITLDLNAFFTNDKTGSFVRSIIYLNAKDLSFEQTAEGWHDAKVQLRGIMFGNNGAVVQQQTFDRKISLRGETYDRALRDGLMMQFDMPVKKPGDYQVRIAALDVNATKVGSAGMFVQVPDLSRNHLALSGIVISGGDSHSELGSGVRRFPLGSNIRFACGIYNAVVDPISHSPKVTIQIQLYREGKQVLSSPPMPVDSSNQVDVARMVTTGVLRLNPDLEPGPYYLQLVATDSSVKDRKEQAMQWLDFEIVR